MENYLLLYYQPGTQAWKQVPVTGETFSIGRAPENNLALEDEQVSRQHAHLHIDARGVWIIDQNSINGVIVGGQRIAAGEWKLLSLNDNFTIGATTLRVEAVSPATSPSQPVTPAAGPARVAQPRQTNRALPLVGLLIAAACVCLVGGGIATWMFLPGLLSNESTASQQAEPTSAPPTVIDSLPASAGGGPVQDEHGVSLEVPPDALEKSGQQAYLERASLSQGMQREIEKAYQVESLVYAARLQDGQDGIGRVELALPAPSPDSRLAVLIDNSYLGILETPAQDGFFRINPSLSLAAGVQTYPSPASDAEQAPNRYLVLTPKAGSSQAPQGGGKLASLSAQTDPDGKPCVTEFWGTSSCWRNPEGSVYVFWKNDPPANLKDQGILRIIDTIKAVATMMSSYQQKGFTAAAIGPSNPAYIVIVAGNVEP
ncbi:MAG: FHA domain-containing protein [Chloroflexota bacterium]